MDETKDEFSAEAEATETVIDETTEQVQEQPAEEDQGIETEVPAEDIEDFEDETTAEDEAETPVEEQSTETDGAAESGVIPPEDAAAEEAAEETPRRGRRSKKAAETIETAVTVEAAEAAEEAPKRRRRRRAAEAETEGAAAESEAEPAASKEPSFKLLREVQAENRKEFEAREERRARNSEFSIGWGGLQAAKNQNRILYGVVASAGPRTVNTKGSHTEDKVFLTVKANGFDITIPFEELYNENPIDMSSIDLTVAASRRDYVNRQIQMARKLITLTIPFCITAMELGSDRQINGDYIILGSRKQAINRIEHDNYTPNASGVARISEGDENVQATITAVGINAVSANVGGIDTKISARNLTYRYVTNLQELYDVGDEILVDVRRVVEQPDGSHRISCSCLRGELEKLKEHCAELPVGTTAVGTITSISAPTERGTLVRVYLEVFDFPGLFRVNALARSDNYLRVGQSRYVEVMGYNRRGVCILRDHGPRIRKLPTTAY